jgi:hypothetical protein
MAIISNGVSIIYFATVATIGGGGSGGRIRRLPACFSRISVATRSDGAVLNPECSGCITTINARHVIPVHDVQYAYIILLLCTVYRYNTSLPSTAIEFWLLPAAIVYGFFFFLTASPSRRMHTKWIYYEWRTVVIKCTSVKQKILSSFLLLIKYLFSYRVLLNYVI